MPTPLAVASRALEDLVLFFRCCLGGGLAVQRGLELLVELRPARAADAACASEAQSQQQSPAAANDPTPFLTQVRVLHVSECVHRTSLSFGALVAPQYTSSIGLQRSRGPHTAHQLVCSAVCVHQWLWC